MSGCLTKSTKCRHISHLYVVCGVGGLVGGVDYSRIDTDVVLIPKIYMYFWVFD